MVFPKAKAKQNTIIVPDRADRLCHINEGVDGLIRKSPPEFVFFLSFHYQLIKLGLQTHQNVSRPIVPDTDKLLQSDSPVRIGPERETPARSFVIPTTSPSIPNHLLFSLSTIYAWQRGYPISCNKGHISVSPQIPPRAFAVPIRDCRSFYSKYTSESTSTRCRTRMRSVASIRFTPSRICKWQPGLTVTMVLAPVFNTSFILSSRIFMDSSK